MAASPHAEIARDFFSLPVEMPVDGDGQRCWRPHPARRSRGTSWRYRARSRATSTARNAGRIAPQEDCTGLLVFAGLDAGRRRRPKGLAASPCEEVAQDFFTSSGKIPGYDNGQKVLAASSHEEVSQDFLSSPGKLPGEVDGQESRPPRPTRRSRGTSCCRRARCPATSATKGAGCLAPQGSRAGLIVVGGQKTGQY